MLNLEGYSGVERYYLTERCLVYTEHGIEWTKKRESGERISEDVCSRILYNTVYMEFGLEEAYHARELILFGRCKV